MVLIDWFGVGVPAFVAACRADGFFPWCAALGGVGGSGEGEMVREREKGEEGREGRWWKGEK